jgi:hypothetical protein
MHQNFFVGELKCNEKKVAEEYCWRGGGGGGHAACRQSSSHTESGIHLDSLVQTCKRVVDHMRTQIRLAQNLLKYFEST